MPDHPVRSIKEASRHLFDVASTPPLEEGITLASKPDSSPDLGIGRDYLPSDHFSDAGHIHQVLVVQIF